MCFSLDNTHHDDKSSLVHAAGPTLRPEGLRLPSIRWRLIVLGRQIRQHRAESNSARETFVKLEDQIAATQDTQNTLSTRGTKFWSENGADPGASGAIRNFDETSLLMLEAGEDDSPSVQMQSGPSPSKMLQSHPSGDVRTTSSPGDARLRRIVSNKIRAVVAEKVLSKVSDVRFAVDVLHSDPSAGTAVLQWLRTGDRSGHVSSRGAHLCVSWWKENLLILMA